MTQGMAFSMTVCRDYKAIFRETWNSCSSHLQCNGNGDQKNPVHDMGLIDVFSLRRQYKNLIKIVAF